METNEMLGIDVYDYDPGYIYSNPHKINYVDLRDHSNPILEAILDDPHMEEIISYLVGAVKKKEEKEETEMPRKPMIKKVIYDSYIYTRDCYDAIAKVVKQGYSIKDDTLRGIMADIIESSVRTLANRDWYYTLQDFSNYLENHLLVCKIIEDNNNKLTDPEYTVIRDDGDVDDLFDFCHDWTVYDIGGHLYAEGYSLNVTKHLEFKGLSDIGTSYYRNHVNSEMFHYKDGDNVGAAKLFNDRNYHRLPNFWEKVTALNSDGKGAE